MNYNSHSRTKQFRKIGGVILSIILLCFCCTIEAKEKGVYYNLTEALQHPTDVQYLYLGPRERKNSNDPLWTLPKEIGKLQNLRDLDLSSNQLMTLPKEIGKLQNLQKLNLTRNRLANLPEEIGKLQNLQELHLENNQLTTLPE
ncbi:leucine-rich repeat domain-containing protein, partial [Leptospira santarosai]|uniref:leucine-rich repeat domain-containing protein n=1 Tax=Leptospira santarosai TaxID=28183 RepID=UPI0024AE9859